MFLLLHHLHARTNPPTTIDSNWASKDSHQPRADPNSFVSSMHHHHHITNICRNNTICPCTRIFVAILFLCGPQSPPDGGHNKILPSSLSPGPPSQLHPKVITICMRRRHQLPVHRPTDPYDCHRVAGTPIGQSERAGDMSRFGTCNQATFTDD